MEKSLQGLETIICNCVLLKNYFVDNLRKFLKEFNFRKTVVQNEQLQDIYFPGNIPKTSKIPKITELKNKAIANCW